MKLLAFLKLLSIGAAMPRFFPMIMTRGCSALKTQNNPSYSLVTLLLSSLFFFPICSGEESQETKSIILSISGVDKKIEENMRHKMSSSTMERLVGNATVRDNRNWKRERKQRNHSHPDPR